MNYEANLLPNSPGVYRWVIDLPVAIHTDVLEASLKSVMPSVVSKLENSPFMLGMFYQTTPDAQGNPKPPSPESRQILMGDQFERGYLDNPDYSNLSGYVWFQPGSFAYYRTQDNPSYSKHVFFYVIVKEHMDAPNGPLTFNEKGEPLQYQEDTSLSGFWAVMGAVLLVPAILAAILGFLLVAWGIYNIGKAGYDTVKLLFTKVKDGIAWLKEKKERLGKAAKEWFEKFPAPLKDVLLALMAGVSTLGSILFWGGMTYIGYRLLKWAIASKPGKKQLAKA